MKHKAFSIINILGLAMGMACCFLILLFIRHEFSFDQFHQKKERIFRVNYKANFGNTETELARVPPPMCPLLPDYFPEVEHSARMFPRSVSVDVKGESTEKGLGQYEVENAYFSDSTILKIFSFEFLKGNDKTALDQPFSVVLTREMAIQFFGSIDVLDKQVFLLGEHPFTITGVVEKFPPTSHLQFNMLMPYQNMFDIEPEVSQATMRNNLATNWIISHSFTYVLLKENQTAEAVNAKFKGFLDKHGSERFRDNQEFSLVPLLGIHLNSTANAEPSPPANLSYLYLFIGIGLITLLIACINFVNLSTASSLGRAREVGVRKVLGAGKRGIANQFLGESLFLSAIAFALSLLLLNIFLPYLNELTQRELSFSIFQNWGMLLAFLGIFVGAGLLAGSYPAFFVSRFRPISILKGKSYANVPKGTTLRKVLISTQFIASIALIAGTLIIYRQLQLIQNQPLGFQKEHILNIPLFSANFNSIFGGVDGPLRQKMNAFEEELLKNTNVEAVTAAAGVPGTGSVRRRVKSENIPEEDNVFASCMAVDYDFLETYKLELVAGRDFDQSFGTDHQNAYIINESAVELFGWESPEAALGREIDRETKVGKVVGVVKDFNYRSLRFPVDAFIMDVSAGVFTQFSVRIKAANVPETVAFIEKTWGDFFPQKVFEYTFLDETIENTYSSDARFGTMIGYFAFLAILISCFGLYGLVMYTAVQKTKEIGVRKILGASITNILVLLSKDFIKLILIAGVIAIPITYFWAQDWLTNYAITIKLDVGLLLLPVLLVVFIALFTLSYQVIKAAIANPVKALRYE